MDDRSPPTVETRVTLRVRGDVDAFSARRLEAAVLDLAELATALVLDLQAVPLVDAAGLHTVRRLRRVLADRDIRFEIRNPTAVVTRVFTAAGLSELLVIDIRPPDRGAIGVEAAAAEPADLSAGPAPRGRAVRRSGRDLRP